MTRCLVGPTGQFDAFLRPFKATAFGGSRTFPSDLPLRTRHTWQQVEALLPPDWRPDATVLWLPAAVSPVWAWQSPLPVIGLAAQWRAHWHTYRHVLPHCDLVLADRAGVEAFARAGMTHARPAVLEGAADDPLDGRPDTDRDIDLLAFCDPHPARRASYAPFLARLAGLGTRWHVHIAPRTPGDGYRSLLARAKLVIRPPAPGLPVLEAFEAVAAGAVLLAPADDPDVADRLHPGEGYAPYTPADLEAVVTRLLCDVTERLRVSAAGRAKAPGLAGAAVWESVFETIRAEWDFAVRRRAERGGLPGPDWRGRLWEMWAAPADADPVEFPPDTVAPAQAFAAGCLDPDPSIAADHLAAMLDELPDFRPAAAVRAEALAEAGRADDAARQARRALAILDDGPLTPAECELPATRPGVSWLAAAWASAGLAGITDPSVEAALKTQLLRWRLHGLLAGLTGDLVHYHEAAVACPDLPPARAALGCALARAGRFGDAIPHLRAAVAADPFDRPAAQALFQALGDAGRPVDQRRLARQRRVLAAAAPGLVPAEDWFATAGPTGDELASIVVVCHDQAVYTRLCLDSVAKYTRRPYELILVDNGSTDDTPALFAEVAARPEADRVEVVRSDANLGFPAGVNRGLAAARGEYVVLLNNDTVVAPKWLDGLVGRCLADWPAVGLVGPVSNGTRPPQAVAAGYDDLSGLPRFARDRREAFAGRAEYPARLTGFCLLARRDVLAAVGGLDERFGLGYFDDDDLSVRVRRAGYRLAVALDTYVHHFGGRTFAAVAADPAALLGANLAKFRDKWGAEEAAGYGPPVGRPRVSLCVIARDEEANLPACLAGLRELFDEIILVDTGSADRTRAVAAGHGARVFDFPWVDDFAAARNECLRHATGDWIFWLDADDRLDPPDRGRLGRLLAGLSDDNAAFVMKCACEPDRPGGAATVVDHVRLFRNDPRVRWTYRVHEQILPALRGVGAEVRWADVTIRHTGYSDPALRRRKLDRDLRLLERAAGEQPGEPFVLFNVGSVYLELGRVGEALAALRASLAASDPRDSIVRKLYALMTHCLRLGGRPAEALETVSAGRGLYPNDAELLFLEGSLLVEAGNLTGAERSLLRLINGSEAAHFASVDASLRSVKGPRLLADVYARQGGPAEAEPMAEALEPPGPMPRRAGPP